MSKRLVLKLGVMVAALGAMTLLQGCDDDGVTVAGAWMPVGHSTLPVYLFGTSVSAGTAAGGGQTATGAPAAGVTTAGALGGGNQVSGVGF